VQKWRVTTPGRPSLGRSKVDIPFVSNSAQFSEYLPFVNRDAECQEVVNAACEQFASLYAPLHISTSRARHPAVTTASSPPTTSSHTASAVGDLHRSASSSASSPSLSLPSTSSSTSAPTSPAQIVASSASADQYDKVYKVYTSGGAPGIGTISNGSNSQLFSPCALLSVSAHVLCPHTLVLMCCVRQDQVRPSLLS
jgi:hypothetical protein